MNPAGLRRSVRAWGRRQLYSLFSSLGTLLAHRLGTVMTVFVLGIAMVLPIGLYVALENLHRVDLHAEEWGAVSVFLSSDATEKQAMDLLQDINARPDASATAISPQQGMEEFRAASGFGQALDVLESNPLPWVILVQPRASEDYDLARVAESLAAWLGSQTAVDTVQLDYKWLQRLASLLGLGRALVTILSVLFSLAVVVVIANTIRMDVANRAEEIEVLSLVGAGDGFIRQPFLYSGFWYGLMGSVLALALLHLGLSYLHTPLERLMDVYGNAFVLTGLDWPQAGLIMAAGGVLGFLGAWISVERYLRLLRGEGLLGRR